MATCYSGSKVNPCHPQLIALFAVLIGGLHLDLVDLLRPRRSQRPWRVKDKETEKNELSLPERPLRPRTPVHYSQDQL